jgi:hypothetical protein
MSAEVETCHSTDHSPQLLQWLFYAQMTEIVGDRANRLKRSFGQVIPLESDVTIHLMRTEIALKYEGPALVDGQMDVYQTSANMIAFTEFMVIAVKETYGSAAEAKAEVAGFEHGSFVTNLVFSVVGSAATIFTAMTPEQLLEVVKGAFELWKHLKGMPPARVEQTGPSVVVTNNNGQIYNVRTESFSLVMNVKAAEAADKFINQALHIEGVDALRIGKTHEPLATVTTAESEYFVPVVPTALVSDNVNRIVLTVVSPVFQDGNKWRLSDGGPAFAAAIRDGDFLMKVDKGIERFGKGDVLEADVRIVQSRTGSKVTIEREVIKVHRHMSPHEQTSFL